MLELCYRSGMGDGGKRPVILVVDDDADHTTILELALRFEGFEVRTADSCAAARAELARGDITAIVTDWSLGDGTALDVVAEARCPAIVLSGLSIEEHRRAFDACLLKPTSAARVAATLRGLRYHRSTGDVRVRAS